MHDDLPFIDEHTEMTDAPPDVVWRSLLQAIRRRQRGGQTIAHLFACEPRRATGTFDGRPGDAIPGFGVIEAEPYQRLVLRGRHRFAEYSLTFILEVDRLRARTHAAFPGTLGRMYRALVIGSRGHRLIVRRLLREISITAV